MSNRLEPMRPQPELGPAALAQLIATVTLALCTLIVATAVSIGLARAAGSSIGADNVPPFATQLGK
ncbi:MAG TPA: hypothetical protein VKW08_16995 [Xanthobacteraceae bacterium]|jgi:hypothetical protein|nr:hypothetical protein [Xanthobacteraceae bacterium]